MFFIIFATIGFIISAFLFFRMARDDIKLLSLRLSDETIFDIFFLTSLAAVLGARLVYVAAHFPDFENNPFKMIVFTHFPGLSFIGGIIGGFIFLTWFLKRKNIFNVRILDLAALSSLPFIILGFLGKQNFLWFGIFIVLAILLFRIYKMRRVTILSFLAVSSIFQVVSTRLLTLEQAVSIIILLFVVFFFVRGLKKASYEN